MASFEGATNLRTSGGDRAKQFLNTSPTQLLFFECFTQGYVKQMGQDVRQDWAINLLTVHALLGPCQTMVEKWWPT
jgi:hypothetical protein